MDIRAYTGIIIEKDGQYLVGYKMLSHELLWSSSPYDAWRTRKKDKAYIVSSKVNGKRFLFNPIVNQLREMKVPNN